MSNIAQSCCANCGTLEEYYVSSQCPSCGYIGAKLKGIALEGLEDETLFIEVVEYDDNKTKAVFLQCIEGDTNDSYLEPFVEITTNIEGAEKYLGEGEIFVKTWSENESLVQPLLKSGFFEDTGKRVKVSSFCEASIWKMTV